MKWARQKSKKEKHSGDRVLFAWKAGENHGKINRKTETLCDEYLIDLNATQAAIRAGSA